ncbi:MAG: TVP38/TMEM64 family protein [candidate division NC10 bacterium]|nr:TVP38/TMEM64 family protein [candidate division NC10 bacterium]
MKKGLVIATVFMLLAGILFAIVAFNGWFALDRYRELLEFYANRKAIAQYIKDAGPYGPIVFIMLQALQVVAAPIPGEATGILGGYLFGTLPGLIYSTIGLTLGSCLGFGLGRWLGLPFVRRFVRQETYHKFDFLTQAKGELVIFLLFLIPGFPKDILCFLLGASPIPFGTFFLVSTVGRIPGTWLLSIQGTQVRGHQYVSLFILLSLLAVVLLVLHTYRDRIFDWMKRHHHRKEQEETSVTKDREGR